MWFGHDCTGQWMRWCLGMDAPATGSVGGMDVIVVWAWMHWVGSMDVTIVWAWMHGPVDGLVAWTLF